MILLKCKICGGDMSISPDKTFGTCEYCGNTMTLPKIDDEARAAAFNRGNHFRRTGEFDKALQVYEKIVEEDPSDAEAHWCCALCRFGIEWVEDPATMEYLPTCHRASFDPFTEDVDYKAAVELSEGLTKRQYIKDAAKIAEVQKGILATSQNEEPFDVFICYKESDENGNRTVDSTLAQDVYYQLTDQGLRTFFARITLEDKVGSEYEPYIFAALNSAKAMVVIGTRPEHFNAVWVKNEWSRYLAIVKRDRSKVLLPCYRDMDPYDLPEQLSILQSYDMSKIGFIQDLIRGIKKITQADEPKATVKETVVVNNTANANAAPLLKRAFMFLEDGEWGKADDFCEQVLNIDPENAQAYIGKLMAEKRVHRQDELADCALPFNDSNNFKKAIRFGDEKVAFALNGYIKHINERNENERLEGIYTKGLSTMKSANSPTAYRSASGVFKTISGYKDADTLALQCIYEAGKNAMENSHSESDYKNAAGIFKDIPGFKDADALVERCYAEAESCRKDAIYMDGIRTMNRGGIDSYEAAIRQFSSISGWKDADTRINTCQTKIQEIKAAEEAKRLEQERLAEEARIAAEKAARKRKKVIAITIPSIIACVALVIVYITVLLPKIKYKKAIELIDSGSYEEAYALLEETGHSDEIAANKYERAKALLASGDYDTAYAFLEETGHSDEITANKYERAKALLASGDYDTAYAFLEETGHSDEITANKYERAKALLESGEYDAAYALLEEIDDNDTIAASKYERAIAYMDSDDYENAIKLLRYLDYKDSSEKFNEAINEYYYATIADAEVGEYVFFGSYEQDNDLSNGKEVIEWLVLEKQDKGVLLISKFALEYLPYNVSDEDVTWGTSSLREWMNKTFVKTAFASEEQLLIHSANVLAEKNPDWKTEPGNNTTDKVFLLSISEANQYFNSDSARRCQATAYCNAQNPNSVDDWCYWWLRSPGFDATSAAIVDRYGAIDGMGAAVDYSVAVRPVLWVNFIS